MAYLTWVNPPGFWQSAMAPQNRLSGSGESAMASRITANRPHRLQTTLTPAQEAVAGNGANPKIPAKLRLDSAHFY
ncbi:MAG: hypothetical protein GDA39_04680 [Hyphomonadaceae bacterium]|nr:hypothetical protein [Hyphomonadaceae bacterium]MBC6412220.1 hypothetical protein [Hyphomonadaceae bacterium]